MCLLLRTTVVLAFALLIGCRDDPVDRFFADEGIPSDPIFTPEKICDAQYVKDRLDQGLSVNSQNGSRRNLDYLVTYAVRHNAMETLQLLLDSGADVDIKSSMSLQKTPLFQAAYQGRADTVRLLLSYGANVDATDQLGNNALREAICSGSGDIVRILLEAGCDPACTNSDGVTMASLGQKHGSKQIIALLSTDDE